MTDDITPLPCPFCGCAMSLSAVARDWWRVTGDHSDDCILLGQRADAPQTDDQKQLLIGAWNRRAAVEVDRQGRPTIAWLTRNEDGDPAMLFFDRAEAEAYCADGVEPEPLVPGQPATVRCNHCGWHGADADLVREVAADEPDDGAADVCPRCKRIGDLQDISQPSASAEHQQLREFYDVLTDDELIVAQQHHIEKLQATLPGRAPFPVRVREG